MKNLREGWQAALPEFTATLIGAPDIPFPPDLNNRVSGNMDFFFRHEYKAFTQYTRCKANQRKQSQNRNCGRT
jgi:hypothetical protein